MNILKPTTLVATGTILMATSLGQAAHAGQLHNGWNYGIDSFLDGSPSAGSTYEIYGMAIKERADSIYVAINANLGLGGVRNTRAADNNVGYGDVFFNFSGQSFADANGTDELFGVRFAPNNDSKVALGVYSNVSATSVTGSNAGYDTLPAYYAASRGRFNQPNTLGTDMPTAEDAYDYLGTGQINNVIESGTRLGDVTSLATSDLTQEGLDFSQFGASGSETFGFSFDRSLLPNGRYIAHLLEECGNDGVAVESVPEPAAMAGLVLLGMTFAGARLRQQKT